MSDAFAREWTARIAPIAEPVPVWDARFARLPQLCLETIFRARTSRREESDQFAGGPDLQSRRRR